MLERISSIQQSHETEVISFDVFGWLLLTVSFIALIFAIDESSAFGLLSIPVLLAMVIFVGSLALFVRHENSFKYQEQSDKSPKIPIINLEVFSEKGFVLSLNTSRLMIGIFGDLSDCSWYLKEFS